ncbi:MAG: leucine-rich repeat protein [Eubacterium sp.]|nr:leucine-rich repeat protein [Eubacterium sp.]
MEKVRRSRIIIYAALLLFGMVTALFSQNKGVYAATITATIGDFDYELDTTDHTATVTKFRPVDANNIHPSVPKTVTYGGVDYTVDTIGYGSMSYWSTYKMIKSVVLPNSIKRIEDSAFNGNKITAINLPKNLEFIGISAFYDSEELTDIMIPSSVKAIGADAFNNCPKLKNIRCYISSGCDSGIAESVFGHNMIWNGSEYEDVPVEGISVSAYHNKHLDKNFNSLTNPEKVEYIPEPIKEIKVNCVLTPAVFGGSVVQPAASDYSFNMVDGDPGYGCFTVNTGYSGWYYIGDTGVMPYYEYSNGEIYDTKYTSFQVELNASSGWFDFSNTKVIFNGDEMEVKSNEYDYYITYFIKYDLDPAKIDIRPVCYENSSGCKVKFEGDDFTTSRASKLIKKGSSIKLIAQAADGYEFTEWRKTTDNMEPSYAEKIGTNTQITVTANEDAIYYAMFRKKMENTGIINDCVKYVYDPGTKTITFSRKEGYDGYCSTGVYYSYSDSPFKGNDDIKNVIFSEGIDLIGIGLFYRCNNIGNIIIPKSVTSIHREVFSECYLHGGDGFTVDEENANYKSENGILYSKEGTTLWRFAQKTGITEFEIPSNVRNLANHSFDSVRLDKLILKNDGLFLYDYAINFSSIKHVEIQDGVKELGDYSDWFSEDTEINIPASVEYVGQQSSFLDSDKLKAINISSGNEVYESIDGVMYKKVDDGLELYRYPNGRPGEVFTTPAGVKSLGWQSFNGYKPQLKEVILSEDIEDLSMAVFGGMGVTTYTVMNPECNVWNVYNGITNGNIMKGYKGSTAEMYAKYESPYYFTFEPLEASLGTLDKPKNLRWDGYIAKWDAVPGAEKYRVELFYKKNGSTYYAPTQITTATEYSFKDWMYDADSTYYFYVTAVKVGYDLSEYAESDGIESWVVPKDVTGIYVDGHVIYWDTYTIDGNEPADTYYVAIYDKDDNIVYYSSGGGTNTEYGSYLKSSGCDFGTYRATIIARRYIHGNYYQVSKLTEFTVDYEDIITINTLDVNIPVPVKGSVAGFPDLGISVNGIIGKGTYLEDYYYNNKYVYKEISDSSSWYYWDYPDSEVEKGKAMYGYYGVIHAKPGYKFASDVEINVNGDTSGIDSISVYDDEIYLTYAFPEGTKICDVVKTVTVSGKYDDPEAGKEIKAPTDVAAEETGLIIEEVYWVKEVDGAWKDEKLTGKFEAGATYGIRVKVKADDENDFCLKTPSMDSEKVFGNESPEVSDYTRDGATYTVKIATIPAPTATPEVTPTPGADDPSATPTPIPGADDPSASPTAEPAGTILEDTEGKAKYKVLSEGVTDSADSSKNSAPTVQYKATTDKKAKKITIPDTVKIGGVIYNVETIGENALKNNKKITSVTIGKNVKEIKKNAFAGCTALKTVNCKSKVLQKIGAYAFRGDKKLTTIKLVTTKLKKKNVGNNAIKGTSKKLKIKAPKKVKKSYQKIFRAKGNKKVKVK